MKTKKAIVVDLDGTLSLTDTFHESLLLLARNKPLLLFMIPFWMSKGRAILKAKVAEKTDLNVTLLPYNKPLIDWLKDKKNNGEQIVLCTGANEKIAQAVAQHLQIFDDVISSNETINITSKNKRSVLVKKFGKRNYDYAGNSNDDLEVWTACRNAIVVNASSILRNKASLIASVSKIFSSKLITIQDWFRAFRVHQWIKNLLLFVPILAAHQVDNVQSMLTLIFAFICFNMIASAVYMMNDLLDLESDRRHPRKRNRPFAAGTLSIRIGTILSLLFAVISLLLGFLISSSLFVCLILYLLLTTIYTLVLKRIFLIDCVTLASLFTIRLIAGAVAVDIKLSFWLLIFSMFIFLSLAFVKRYAELKVQLQEKNSQIHGRGYTVSDASFIEKLGIAGGYSAVLVLAFYLNSETVKTLYSQPMLIWFTLPLLFIWISWVWMKARRGKMHDDPVVFALKDKVSLLVAGLIAIFFVLAIKGVSI